MSFYGFILFTKSAFGGAERYCRGSSRDEPHYNLVRPYGIVCSMNPMPRLVEGLIAVTALEGLRLEGHTPTHRSFRFVLWPTSAVQSVWSRWGGGGRGGEGG